MIWGPKRTCEFGKREVVKKFFWIPTFSNTDQSVVLERQSIKQTTPDFSASGSNSHFSAKVLARKGNETQKCLDPHSCCFCHKVSANRGLLRQHLEKVHLRTTKLQCDLCPRICFTKLSIADHMIVHKEKIFACNDCGYKTAFKTIFRHHEMTHRAKVECPICKRTVTILEAHMRSHKSENCGICGILLKGKGDLRM